MRKKLFLGILAGVFLFAGCGTKSSETSMKEAGKSETVEKKESGGVKAKCAVAYDFDLPSVSGKKIKLSDYKGKAVILQFFGVFCPSCKEEIPTLNKLYDEFKGKVEVIGMNTDYDGAPPPELKEFVKAHNIKYPVVVIDTNTWMNYPGLLTGSDIIPQTFFIDPDGNVCYFSMGYVPGDEKVYRETINRLLHG